MQITPLADVQAGAVFGALFSSGVSDRIGRRLALVGNIFIYFVGAALMTAASGSAAIGLMYAGRALTGWGVGASSMLVPVYVAECSPPHIRGRLVGLYEVGVQLGVMVSPLMWPLLTEDRVLDSLRHAAPADRL